MRVLVVGQGYIGTVMTPMLLKAGHEVVGYDSDLYRRCTYPAGGDDRRRTDDRGRTRATSMLKTSRASTPSSSSGALSNDPLGNLNPGMTDEINHVAPPYVPPRSPRRLASSASCSPPLAATPVPAPTMICLTRNRSARPAHAPTASPRSRPRSTWRSGRTELCPDLLTPRSRSRRLSAHALRTSSE